MPPDAEQRRIADVLDTVDAAIQETDNVVGKQEQVKTGLLQDLLTRGLNADGRLRDPEREPEAFRETEVGRVPKAWEVQTCAEVLSMSNGKSKTQKELEAETGEIPVWGGNGMTGYCSDPLVDRRGIVIGRVGEYCGSVHLTEGPAWITDNAIFATVESERVSLDYVAQYLKWFDLSSKSTRTGQPLMTQTAVKEVPFLRPSLDEQERIVDRVQSLQDQQREEKSHQDKLRRLKSGLMQDLLTGRVRVPEVEARVDEIIA
jgi:type I restriction enzyme S subunit